MLVSDALDFLDTFAPRTLAADWDNVGLLLGDRSAPCDRVMTCLTLTADVAEEAIRERVNLVVTHHPILFKAVKKLTRDDPQGAMLLDLVQAGVSVYSPHTAFDSAHQGINQQLAEAIGLRQVVPLRPDVHDPALGQGRRGDLPTAERLGSLAARIARWCGALSAQFVGDPDRQVQHVGLACGAAAEFLGDARRAGCEAFITGEARFHDAVDARTHGIGLILLGHYGSERPGVEHLAKVLTAQLPGLSVWASRAECDPLNPLPPS